MRAELSSPIEYKSGYVIEYSERIFIIRDGEWEQVTIDSSSGPSGQDFDINVVRKEPQMFTRPARTLARERRRFTKRALAEAIEVTAHTVLRYESGEIVPADEALER